MDAATFPHSGPDVAEFCSCCAAADDDERMKRIVLCCDGTWQTEASPWLSNIVKIAASVQPHAPGTTPSDPSTPQLVDYLAGPGGRGYLADRVVGGALAWGAEANLSSAYFEIATKWEPGDEIFLFGFSRGAFTARQLAGMLGWIGVLTREALFRGALAQALQLYMTKNRGDHEARALELQRFRRDYCHSEPVEIGFLGVFDTVGAYGVPGALGFLVNGIHDLRLTSRVRCARHALALDERRRHFAPTLWENEPVQPAPRVPQSHHRIRQVWFRGAHSDIGGGYQESGLSDISLRWMIGEAEQQGLAIDHDFLDGLIAEAARQGDKAYLRRHDSRTWPYRVLNGARLLHYPTHRGFYLDSWRRLALHPQEVLVAASALDGEHTGSVNLERLKNHYGGQIPAELIERHA